MPEGTGWYGTKEEGELTRERMMRNLPKYGELCAKLEQTLWKWVVKDYKTGTETDCQPDHPKARRVRRKQWLRGLDGRKLYVRHDHAALNTLLQSAGSIVVKAATVYARKAIKNRKLDAKQVGHFHDEVQYECRDEATAKLVGELFIQGIKWAEQRMSIRCPLDGEYKIGRNWAECH